MPKPFDLAAILSNARGTGTITTPPVLVRYKDKVDSSAQESLSLNAGNPRRQAAERALGKPEVIAGAEAFALYGYGIAEKFAAIDEHVYESMSRLSGENIDTLGNLSASLVQWKHGVWNGLNEHGLYKLGGHLGEVYAAKHLSDSGVAVDWPSVSNQKGYDLLVSGHEVNVKSVADVHEIHTHFAKYPDIAALVPADAAHIPANAFHFYPGSSSEQALQSYLDSDGGHKVIVDHGLSHDQLYDQAADASDAALGGGSLTDLHFPWITAATSSWREWRLLSQSKTTLDTAIAHVGLDVVGRGGGAAVGGKVGATAGSLLGPIGAAVGGVLGAVAGAVWGGSKTDEIKYSSLKKAQSEYQAMASDFRVKASIAERKIRDDFKALKYYEQQSLITLRTTLKSGLQTRLGELKAWRSGDAQLITPDRAQKIIISVEKELYQFQKVLLKVMETPRPWRQALWPSTGDLAKQDALVAIEDDLQYLRRLQDKTVAGESLNSIDLFANLSRIGVGEKIVAFVAETVESERKQREGQLQADISNAYKTLAAARAGAFQRLGTRAIVLRRDAEAEMRPAVEAMQSVAARLTSELRKHGMA